jgi:beta-glucosidase
LEAALLFGVAAALAPQTACFHLRAETQDIGGGPSGSGSGGSAGAPDSGMGSVGGSSSGPDIILDGGLPDALTVTKMACGDSTKQLSHTPAAGLDISNATGYKPDATVQSKVASIVAAMNKTQLANQMRGPPATSGGQAQFNDLYRTLDDTVGNVKGLMMRDGPRGVQLFGSIYTGPTVGSNLVNTGAGYATAFPVPAACAASWDLDLEYQIGVDLADEVQASGNTMTLSPCVNILRHPAWGRSQETFGEDTFAVGRMGSAYVHGVQQRILACVKHFAANNIEFGRFNQNAEMDDQTLHEVYGRHFEMIIQDAGVACVMAAYNAVNGVKSTVSTTLLTDLLRGTFGFKGFVMSDFWALPNGTAANLMPAQYDAVALAAINAGLDLEAPVNLNFQNAENVATMQQLVTSATRIIAQKVRFNVVTAGQAPAAQGLMAPTSVLGANGITNNDSHVADAERMAEESIVLVKNDNHTLPINRSSVHTIAVIGAAVPWRLSGINLSGTVNFATEVRTGDRGSSRVTSNPAQSVGPADGIGAAAGNGIMVASGTDPNLADNADFVVVVAGMTPADEGEEYTGAGDRTDNMSVPNFSLDGKSGTNAQNDLIAAVAMKNKPMVVVLEGGSAINMPWLSMVSAVVFAYYPGQAGGTALGKLLFGDVNFSGKTTFTWPKSELDEPPFSQGGTSGGTTMMGYYHGYQYFDKMNIAPLYPFGHGLSYTTFRYETILVPCSTVTKHGFVDVQVAVTNIGTVPGNEVSFLFVAYPNTQARRPDKELKGFHRTSAPVMPGQTVLFTIPVRIQDLKYWNTSSNPAGWTVESGPVQLMVGPSSDNLPLQDTITVQ